MPITALVIGGGERGSSYAAYSIDHPDELKVVGLAEPRECVRDRFCNSFKVNREHVYVDWRQALSIGRFADIAIISTPDRLHKEPAIAAAKKGYHILLEKPMAPTQADCEEIYNACKSFGVKIAVCHVLRYTDQSIIAKSLIDGGAIGRVVNIQLLEPVGFWHFAHSFVRGNWHKESESAPALLAKSCHDIDLLQYWLGDVRCTAVSSFGSVTHFASSDKPTGAGSNCMECPVEELCPYSSKRLYLGLASKGHWGWPVSVVTEGNNDLDELENRLLTGDYGRCVYDCDNDVCSNQVVNMEFENGETASFSMVAFTEKVCVRQVRIHGTKGQLEFSMDSKSPIHQYDFLRQTTVEHAIDSAAAMSSRLRGHGGADYCLMKSFVRAVKHDDSSIILTGAKDSLASHLLVFAAEKARLTKSVVKLTATGPDGLQSASVN